MGNLKEERNCFDPKKHNSTSGPSSTSRSNPATKITKKALYTKTKRNPKNKTPDEVYHQTYNGLFP